MKNLWIRIFSIRYHILNLATLMLYLVLVYVWQQYVLPQEKGLFSPFQSGISLIRYLGIIVLLNASISIASINRQLLWVIAPIIANAFLLLYTAFYIWTILRID